MDKLKFTELVHDLYSVVNQLESMFPGRPFTPDGHLVGSLGETLVANHYALQLEPPSNAGYDASDSQGRRIEIKCTQRDRVAFRSCPEIAIVIKLNPDGRFDEIYNGPGSLIWECFDGKAVPSNGQHQITLSKLRQLQRKVDPGDCVPRDL